MIDSIAACRETKLFVPHRLPCRFPPALQNVNGGAAAVGPLCLTSISSDNSRSRYEVHIAMYLSMSVSKQSGSETERLLQSRTAIT